MESLFEIITTEYLYTTALIFTRVLGMLFIMPGFGSSYINSRTKVALSVVLALLISPIIHDIIKPIPQYVSKYFALLIIELFIGFFYGIIAKIFITIAQIIGMMVSTQSALSSAMLFDPNQGSQDSVVSNFYSFLTITIFLLTNSDHILISGIIDSYNGFKPGQALIIGDFTTSILAATSKSLIVAVKLSSPVIIVSFIILVGAGILSKLMPGIQVFFILSPVQIILSLFMIMATMSTIVPWLNAFIKSSLSNFLQSI